MDTFINLKEHRKPLFILGLISLALFLFYLLGFSESVFSLDDDLILIPQVRCSLGGIKSIFEFGHHVDYYPLRDLTYVVDWCLGGNPLEYGFVARVHNFLLFIFSCYLIYFSTFLITKNQNRSLFVALLLLVHPINSETFMWIAGRKDVLALFFLSVSVFLGCYYFVTQKKAGWILGLLVLCFTMSLFSKAGTATVPFAFLVFCFFERKKMKIPRPFFPVSLVSSAIAIAFLLLQKAQYSEINNMYFPYTLSYRALGVLTALGRYFAGSFWYGYNAMEAANWAPWAQLNFPFTILGGIFLFLYAFLIFFFWRRKSILMWALVIPIIIYIVNPGPNIFHRNFYSTRYFVPSFWSLIFLLGIWVPRSGLQFKRQQVIGFLVVIFFLGQSYFESLIWSENTKVTEKAVRLSPKDAFLRFSHLLEQMRLIRWAKASPSMIEQAKENLDELTNLCPCNDQVASYPNSHLCLSFWTNYRGLFDFFKKPIDDYKCFDLERKKSTMVVHRSLDKSLPLAENDIGIKVRKINSDRMPSMKYRFVKASLACLDQRPEEFIRLVRKYKAASLWVDDEMIEYLAQMKPDEKDLVKKCFRDLRELDDAGKL